VGGEVSIVVSTVAGDPTATAAKMQMVLRAALAPGTPPARISRWRPGLRRPTPTPGPKRRSRLGGGCGPKPRGEPPGKVRGRKVRRLPTHQPALPQDNLLAPLLWEPVSTPTP